MSIEVKSSSGRGVVAISTRIEETKRVSRYDEPSPNVKTLFSTACGHNGTEILHECMALQVLVGVLNESSHLCNLLMDGEQLSLPPGSSMPVRVTAESDISAWRWSLPDTKRFGVVIVPNSIKEKIQILLQQVQLRMPCRVILDSIKVEIDGGEMIVSVPTRSPLNMKLTLKRASIANDSAVSAKIRLRLVVTDSYGSNVIESFRSGRWNVELDVAPNDSIEHRVVVGFTQSGIYYLHSAACITTESGEIVWQYKGFIKIHSVAPAVT